jgi:haloacetate dehalogenase
MFEGFERGAVETPVGPITYVVGGFGPPVLLLHGFPQTHVMWRHVAARLARDFTVVATDLRGYGDSAKPPGDEDHAAYSKRAMAEDQVRVMAALGFERFALVGHDRGGRVAHRLALDHPDRVSRLALLDISPTLAMFRQTDQAFATAYFHWFFMIQPRGLPERMIGADPDGFAGHFLLRGPSGEGPAEALALAEYLRCFRDPRAIHASCEDYRAAAGIDLVHDEADLDRRIDCPLLVLWGGRGVVHRLFDPLADWSQRARSVRGAMLDCGHYIAEERPEECWAELDRFLKE